MIIIIIIFKLYQRWKWWFQCRHFMSSFLIIIIIIIIVIRMSTRSRIILTNIISTTTIGKRSKMSWDWTNDDITFIVMVTVVAFHHVSYVIIVVFRVVMAGSLSCSDCHCWKRWQILHDDDDDDITMSAIYFL